jgi:cytochrome c-type biogenesis protein CcmF
MAVAPALPWRKTTVEVMRGRLAVPAALGVVVVVVCVVSGIHGVEPLLAFGLGTFAAASAGRALVLSVRGAWRAARSSGSTPARAVLAGWRGMVGRANGGMIVHIGVVLIAVGLAAATAFGQHGEVHLRPGQSAGFDGHTVEFVGTTTVSSSSHSEFRAALRVDGGTVYYPAISQFGAGSTPVGTPAIDSTVLHDVYLTIDNIPDKGTVWTFGVVVQPLVMWLWLGGSLIVVGSVLSAIPGRRRRPTDPVSAPVAGASGHAPPEDRDRDRAVDGVTSRPGTGGDRLPVGAGDAP